jgi:hypothetical protein
MREQSFISHVWDAWDGVGRLAGISLSPIIEAQEFDLLDR